jgi:hypothetical protein
MKRRKPAPRVKSTQTPTFFNERQTHAWLAEIARKGRSVPSEEADIFTLDGQPLDFAAQPRAKTCGVCGSIAVVAYVTVLDPTSIHDTDDGAVIAAIVLGVCGACEELGPDAFLPAMERRLREERSA